MIVGKPSRPPRLGLSLGGSLRGFNPFADKDLATLGVFEDASDNGTTLTAPSRNPGGPTFVSTGGGRGVLTTLNGFKCVDTTGMNVALAAAIASATGKTAQTFYLVAKHDSLTASQIFQMGSGNQSWFAYYSIAPGGFQTNKQLGTSQRINLDVNGGLRYPRVVCFRYDNANAPDISSVRQQGLSGPATPSGTDQSNPLAAGSLYIGSTSGGGSPFDGKILAWALINRRHTDAEAARWEQYLNGLIGQAFRKEVAIDGDSIMANSPVGSAQFRARIEALYRAEAAIDGRYWYHACGPSSPASTPFTNDYCYAAGGSTIAGMQANWAVTARLLGTRYVPDLHLIMCLTNDVAAGTTNVAISTAYRTALNDIRVKSPGTKVVAMKPVPRNDAFNAQITDWCNNYHDAMVASAQSDGCNVISDSTLRNLAPYSFLDGVHIGSSEGSRMGDALWPKIKEWVGL